jgi:hypothetical protein
MQVDYERQPMDTSESQSKEEMLAKVSASLLKLSLAPGEKKEPPLTEENLQVTKTDPSE